MSEKTEAMLRLDNYSIDILCSNPYCHILYNKSLPYKVVSTRDGEVELVTDKCQKCGNITRVTITLKAESINVKQYKNVKVNDLLPKSDTIHSNICMSCVNYKIATELYYPCDRCRRSMLWQGFGDDYYKMI